uniref:Uncharacterized protein n=1 Tax=Candidatus Methanogaster sp. ANME-2c ERB4 TaxID=2759911 RepID=A0A7G9YCJ7_9EURY|nr:hypothetical protein MPGNBCFJ_00003 [Methanosarcinales archaeon ANME-2c ERB4]QNO42053.1 hypothetical protein NIICAKKE_00003 [Methanosarcinales archaeon ANME-2c ERB4]QNO42300.1 hypothetical protein OEDCDHIP_00017 [Methanosarcinales archaeon ANME-2c ERB4]QNO42460.1 hypothetical protein LBOOMNCC_00013 [Methanosarcinales archaeon ANME-2c ERB4]QNO42696.1 hypothetical protein LJMFLAAN_00007 [Methanosarcinales archaeon ANME-2c ERB4]
MKQLEKHRVAFETYYHLRNDSATARELGISRQSVGKWKVEFGWDAECEDRDHEVAQRTRDIIVPEYVDIKVELIRALATLIKGALEAGIAINDIRELVAASKELRALTGEADKHEIISTIKHELTDDPDIMAAENDLLKLVAKKESNA